MGAVYAALDTRLERRIALKVMLPASAADANAKGRFLREARAAARIKHDNVVTVYEADERLGVPYIAMEFLDGYPLDGYLKKKGNLAILQVLRIGAEAAAGLAAAHKIGLVHRDIKPANLWLEAPHGRVKVLDFGLARPVDAEVELTQSGAIVGTPAYMSPEQARGEKVDHRTDLFSLGGVLYRLCTGTVPFHGPSVMSVLMALGTQEPPPVRDANPDVPESLAALIHQLLAKRADARPQSAAEVVQRLRAIATTLANPSVQVLHVPMSVTAAPEASPFADLDTELVSRGPVAAPVRKKPGSRWRAVAAGFAAFSALVLCGVIVVIRNRDGTETRIEVPDGATVTVKGNDGKTLAQVGPVKKPVVAADPDRAAATWVIAQGGFVRVLGADNDIKSAAGLPKDRFTVTQVNLSNTEEVTDAGLERFKDLKSLTRIGLFFTTKVTDVGLEHIKEVKGLTNLDLHGTKVSDVGLVHLTGLKGLTQLGLHHTQVSDVGLVHLKELRSLTDLGLYDTKVTDVGLVQLKELKSLTCLTLSGTLVSDVGLAHLKEIKGLTQLRLHGTLVTDAKLSQLTDLKGLTLLSLYDTNATDSEVIHLKDFRSLTSLLLGGTQVSDAGVAHLRDLKNLDSLDLFNTQVTDVGLVHLKDLNTLTILNIGKTAVTDAGLEHLKDIKSLNWLNMCGTRVTAKGLAAFAATLPACKIEHDSGIIERTAAADPNREAAIWVIAKGGTVRVAGADKDIKASGDLPKERFALTHVDLVGAAVTDAGLAHLKDLKGLTFLNLQSTRVSDAGLQHLKDIKGLAILWLAYTKVTDAGLVHLKDLKGLTRLGLESTVVTDAGLVHLKDIKGLADLMLSSTKVSDAGLIPLKDLKGLTHLDLNGTKVTDAGLAHLKDLKGLTHLNLHRTQVTDAGLAHLKDIKGLGFLTLSGTQVSDSGLISLKDVKGLTHLFLDGTAVTDGGLEHLKELKGLDHLEVHKTKVTPKGLAAFAAALPACRIEHDDGVIEPKP